MAISGDTRVWDIDCFNFWNSPSDKATIFIWMLACILTGTAIGFLFGIPKIIQNNQLSSPGTNTGTPAYQQRVNTNLTEISDWLTKIIVGLGLVNLTKIPTYLSLVAKTLAAGLSQPPAPSTMAFVFAYGSIVTYLVLGFLFDYINTRLYLAVAFSEANQIALRVIAQKTAEAAGAAQSALQKAEFALIPPADSRQKGSQNAEEELEELTETYNQLRSTMPSRRPRTGKMGEVMKRIMALVPLLTTFDISQELNERNNGKRLAGYAYLYIKPDYKWMGKLAEAIAADPTPFGQYWGIQALGKVIELLPNNKMDPEIFAKLKVYYDKLDRGIDREYELSKILPELKK